MSYCRTRFARLLSADLRECEHREPPRSVLDAGDQIQLKNITVHFLSHDWFGGDDERVPGAWQPTATSFIDRTVMPPGTRRPERTSLESAVRRGWFLTAPVLVPVTLVTLSGPRGCGSGSLCLRPAQHVQGNSPSGCTPLRCTTASSEVVRSHFRSRSCCFASHSVPLFVEHSEGQVVGCGAGVSRVGSTRRMPQQAWSRWY